MGNSPSSREAPDAQPRLLGRVRSWRSLKRTLARLDLMPSGLSGASAGSRETPARPGACRGALAALPPDILTQIFSRCSAEAFPRLRCVCRSFRDALVPADMAALRAARGLQEQWVLVAACRGSPPNSRLYITAFHCQSRRWCTLAVPPELRYLGPGFGVAALGHCLYITGGSVVASKGCRAGPSRATWCFDLFTNTWAPRAPMNSARRFHAIGAVAGKLVVVGGLVGGSDLLSEVYDPEADTWHEIPGSGVPARALQGWVVSSSLYVRDPPDRLYKISLPDPSDTPSPADEQRQQPKQGLAGPRAIPLFGTFKGPSAVSASGGGHLGSSTAPDAVVPGVHFEVAPFRRFQRGHILAGMDYVTSAGGRVYGCMIADCQVPSVGVYNERSRAWHLLIGNGGEFHRILEKFEGMVCGGGCIFIITHDDALLQIVMEDRGRGLAGPEWVLLSAAATNQRAAEWRQFACLEL